LLKTGFATALFLIISILLLAENTTSGKWEVQYFYDHSDGSLTLADFKFTSPQRGIATGFLTKRVAGVLGGSHEKVEPVAVITVNGGKTWDEIAIKPFAESLFFLNDTLGWLVAPDGVWMTNESGRTWKRVSNLKGLNEVWFLTAAHGFAAGDADRLLETQDGGTTWKPIIWEKGAVPQQLNVSYHAIAFSDSQNAIVAGQVPPTDETAEDLPTRFRHPRRELNAFVYTHDGGKTWHRSVNEMYGEMTRLSLLPDGMGLALLQFPQSYEWPSEVFRLKLGTDEKNHLQYRSHDRAITDVLLRADGDSYAAGYQPPGNIHPSPIPGKMRILRSADLETWEEMPVDYRAVARQVWLASPEPGAVWAATDTGMILKLNSAK
jgi:hypothetical protein